MTPQNPNKAVFLDRDGVLNATAVKEGTPYPPANVDQLSILPGVVEATKRLKEEGFLLIVVTNQPDVARGTVTKDTVEEINHFLMSKLPIDEFRTCFHDTLDDCSCRKPKPGAILDAARKWGIDLGQSFMVGDRWRDIDAGKAAGVRTIFIDYGYKEKQPWAFDFKASSLLDALPYLLGLTNNSL